jgi:hypothetical protein
MKIIKKVCIASVLVVLFFGLMSCLPLSVTNREQYSNPEWAPDYYPGVRYYYIPDIETYYDLSSHDFVYLDNGQWFFSNSLPSMYNNYDLYNGYEIALNTDVYQPWMHHHFYLSNYPRYYYNNVYHNSGSVSIRGFNENDRKPFYSTPEDKVRRSELYKNNKPVIVPQATRQSQQPNYYGRNIGKPVKVQPQMRQVRPTAQPRKNSEASQNSENKNENGKRERR